jgi:hypothetical protein
MAYTKQQIIDMCEEASKDMKSFYKAKFINYSGYSKEKIPYTEIVSEWLLNNIEKLNEISQTIRESSYNTNHTGNILEITNRAEEYLAKQLYNSHGNYDGVGIIIDYQTPLKNKRSNKGLGKIDLLSRNDSNKSIYILELKKADSNETMLRCVLEAYTYLKTVSKEKLFKDFGIPADYKLCASPLTYYGSYQHNEYLDKDRKFLHLLMNKLDSYPFFIEERTIFHIRF